jgi:ABC-2 type transport system ATP-binding protein
MSTTGRVLDVRDLRKRFGEINAVRGVSFYIDAGETYGLLGPNGAGKTTTISMISGILERDSGQVLVDGRPLTTRSPHERAAIGLVPQDLAIYPDLTARENLRFFGRLYGMNGSQIKERVARVLDVVGLTDRADDKSKEYSGGMKRRLNIGIGLLHEPKLLILDEPTVGVDPQSRNAILESVEQLATEGMAVLYTTHYMEEAERLCHRVGIIDEGMIRAEGSHRELVSLVGQNDSIRLTASGDLPQACAAAASLPGVDAASVRDGSIHILTKDAGAVLPGLLAAVASAGAHVSGVEVVEPNLETVFLHLTGKALRD